MNVLVFKTDLQTRKRVNAIGSLFDEHPGIQIWSVDVEDVDNVLRIEAEDNLLESDIIRLTQPCVFNCVFLL